MESQTDHLLEKYWSGKTSLEEEQVIKNYFKENPSLTREGSYFRYLAKKKGKTLKKHKATTNRKKPWLSAVATVAIGILTALIVFDRSQKDPFAENDPQKAFEVTRNALMMIGAGLNEGQSHTMELTKFNKVKEELQKDETEAL